MVETTNNFFKAIFIPRDPNIPLSEIELPKESLVNFIEKTYFPKGYLKFFVYAKEPSYVITRLQSEVSPNARVRKILRKDKDFCDSIFIRCNNTINGQDGEVSTSIKEFEKFDKFISNNIYDFENLINGKPSNKISTILERSDFKINNTWIYSKTAYGIVNEYFKVPATYDLLSVQTSGPFAYKYCVPKTNITIYSRIHSKQADAKNDLSHKYLHYLLSLQNNLLFNTEIDYSAISNTKSHLLKDLEQFNIDHNTVSPLLSVLENEREINNIDNNNAKVKESLSPSKVLNDTNEYHELLNGKYKLPIDCKREEYYDGDIIKFIIESNDLKENKFDFISMSTSFKMEAYLRDSTLVDKRVYNDVLVDQVEAILGVKYIVSTMNNKERAIVRISPKYAYGDLGLPSIVPPGCEIIVYIEIINIQNRNKPTNLQLRAMTPKEKLSKLSFVRLSCRDYCKKSNYIKALNLYKNSRDYFDIQFIGKVTDEEWDEFQSIACTFTLNIAICYANLKPPQWNRALEFSVEAIEYDEFSPKIYFWISKCYENLEDYSKALEYIEKCWGLIENPEDNNCKIKLTKNEYERTVKRLKSKEQTQNNQNISISKEYFNDSK